MKTSIKFKTTTLPPLITLALLCFALSPKVWAIGRPPPNCNTSDGYQALFNVTTGIADTAFGGRALFSDTTGSDNTATGCGALANNTIGNDNTAIGSQALHNNIDGDTNTAVGYQALFSAVHGHSNNAVGYQALYSDGDGGGNNAVGNGALGNNTTGILNTAIGHGAGFNQTTGTGDIYIGAGMFGTAGESNACYIASIFGQTSADGAPVLIDGNNKLGTVPSSKRFKEEIKPMDKASEALFALKPVTFRYKKEIDLARTSRFGLVAEDVEKVNPALVVRDKEGKPYTVRYDAVNAMLLNEFLKEHKTVQELKKQIAVLTATVKEQESQIRNVSTQVQTNALAPQMVSNNP